MPSPTIVQWGGITIAGDNSSAYHLDSLVGWRGDLPAARIDSEDRPNQHGESDTPVWSGARTVTVAGSCRTNATRDALFAALTAAMVYTGDASPATLTVQDAGLTLTAAARVTGHSPSRIAGAWGLGQFGFQAQWRCADPLLYGAAVSDTANMGAATGGLQFPLFNPLPAGAISWGTLTPASSCDLTNFGSMDSPVLLTIVVGANSLVGGMRITETVTGRILQYADDLPAGSTLVIDGSNGTVQLNGADRNGSLTIRQFTPVPGTYAFGGVPQTRSYTVTGLTSTSPTLVLTGTIRPAYL